MKEKENLCEQSFFFFFSKRAQKQPEKTFIFFSFSISTAALLHAMPPPAPIGAASSAPNVDSRSVLSLSIAIPETAEAGKGFSPPQKKSETTWRNQQRKPIPLTFPFLLARSRSLALSKPKSRSSRANRHDNPKQETLRDGLNNVRDPEREGAIEKAKLTSLRLSALTIFFLHLDLLLLRFPS